jgi:hypothetical protein
VPRHAQNGPLTYPRLLLCEGPHDAAFFRELITERALPDFHVRCDMAHPGKGGFGFALTGIGSLTGFQNVQHVIIAADSDNNPNDTFDAVVNKIKDSEYRDPATGRGRKYQAMPAAPHVPAGNLPSLTVLLVPWLDRVGALETLCLEAAARNKAGALACVQAHAKCTGAHTWTGEAAKAKMLLRSLICSTYEDGPDIGLGNVWRDQPDLVPINDNAFDQIADFLSAI